MILEKNLRKRWRKHRPLTRQPKHPCQRPLRKQTVKPHGREANSRLLLSPSMGATALEGLIHQNMHGQVFADIMPDSHPPTCKSVTLSQPTCLRSAMSNNRAIAGCTAILALDAIEREVDGPSDLPVTCGGERERGSGLTAEVTATATHQLLYDFRCFQNECRSPLNGNLVRTNLSMRR